MTSTNTHDHPDLRRLVEHDGPFLTIELPTPSRTEGAAHRFEVEWRNVRRQVDSEWEADLEALDELVASLPHDGGESLVLIRARGGGPTVAEFLDVAVPAAGVWVDPLPHLVRLLHARQRAVPSLLVVTDRTGADLTAFDGGTVVASDEVEGETMHIHRGHPGGWSQRRFQQRAENRWEENADTVVDAVTAMCADLDPVVIAVTGDVRARTLVLDGLPAALAPRAALIEAGASDAVADELRRLVATYVATETRDLLADVRERVASGTATADVAATLSALEEGRVATLLVHEDDGEQPLRLAAPRLGAPEAARTVDVAVAAALRSGAAIRVVPTSPTLDGPIGAVLRW